MASPNSLIHATTDHLRRHAPFDRRTMPRHSLSLSTAKSRLLRAREKMRSHMSAACQVQFDEDGQVAGHTPRK